MSLNITKGFPVRCRCWKVCGTYSSSPVATAAPSFAFPDSVQDAKTVWKASSVAVFRSALKDALEEADKGVCSGEFITEKMRL